MGQTTIISFRTICIDVSGPCLSDSMEWNLIDHLVCWDLSGTVSHCCRSHRLPTRQFML